MTTSEVKTVLGAVQCSENNGATVLDKTVHSERDYKRVPELVYSRKDPYLVAVVAFV